MKLEIKTYNKLSFTKLSNTDSADANLIRYQIFDKIFRQIFSHPATIYFLLNFVEFVTIEM